MITPPSGRPVSALPAPHAAARTTGSGRRYILAVTSLGCAIIAVILWSLSPSFGRNGFVAVFIHAQLIGLTIASLCIGARHWLLPEPPGRLTLVCTNVVCAMFGLGIGLLLSRLVLGLPLTGAAWMDGRDMLVLTLVTTGAASAGFIAYFHSQARLAELARRAAEESRRADAARLALLRTQLDPHMLFNTLANLKVLIGTDAPRAERMVDHLVPFLRSTLDGSREESWTLEREFEELHHYLEIMSIRLGPRLAFELTLPAALTGVTVPALLLQPLVENAIRHGIEPAASGGSVEVRAESMDTGELHLIVSNTGRAHDGSARSSRPSAADHGANGPPFGIENVRERLSLRYGRDASMTIETGIDTGRLDQASTGADPHRNVDRAAPAYRVLIRLPNPQGAVGDEADPGSTDTSGPRP